MNHQRIDEYCLAKQGAVKKFKEEWLAAIYTVVGKMFALQGDDSSGKAIITLKLTPLEGSFLRSQYKDITAGYYINKEHWNSVCLNGSVPDEVVRDMKSYSILFTSLSKKAQREIILKAQQW